MVSSFARQTRGLTVLISLLAPARAALAGDLDKAGQEARQGTPARSEPSHSSHHDSHHHSHHDGDEALGQLLAPVIGYVFVMPWYLPNRLVEGDRPEDYEFRTRFADYPYADGVPGSLIEPPPNGTDDATLPRSRGKVVVAQLAAEASFIGSLQRAAARARLQFRFRLELDSDWSRYQEFNPGNDVDVAWWGREHLTFRFAQSSAIQFRSGVGPQHWQDAKGWVHGVDFTWGFEAFPARPWVLAFEASLGNLGKAVAGGLYGRIGVMLGPVEMGAGWHQRWIGSVALGGPFISAQLWL